ncbi:MAG: hypothetical protein PVI33_04540 [Candidatus Omnitrophota bacterium]|jgi:hypothetical protein
MLRYQVIKKILMKGGETEMKCLGLILAVALILGVPAMVEAQSIGLSVNASVEGGTSLGTHTLIACNGYNYNESGDPWTQAACYSIVEGGTTLTFGGINGVGPLTNRLRNSSGTDIGGAGCFYGANFFIVYLYPDAWGGYTYELRQQASAPGVLGDALVFTPVYSTSDRYAGSTVDQTALGVGETLGTQQLARNDALILESDQARIVRAEYGIPPLPDPDNPDDTRPSGWNAIPLDTPSGSYSASVTITLYESSP